jgi:hypothetical protein
VNDAVDVVESSVQGVGIADIADDLLYVSRKVGGPPMGMDPLLE